MQYLLPEMLDTYDLPWYYDTFDSRYLFVKTHTDNYLQEGPFQHTKRLRLENTYLTEHSQQTLEHNLEESEPEREKIFKVQSICIKIS